MTVFEAEQAVKEYWHAPVQSSLLEAARFQRLMADIAHGISDDAALWTLFARLGGQRGRGYKAATEPALTLLAELIDRRERLDIPRPRADEE